VLGCSHCYPTQHRTVAVLRSLLRCRSADLPPGLFSPTHYRRFVIGRPNSHCSTFSSPNREVHRCYPMSYASSSSFGTLGPTCISGPVFRVKVDHARAVNEALVLARTSAVLAHRGRIRSQRPLRAFINRPLMWLCSESVYRTTWTHSIRPFIIIRATGTDVK
jgi:hypothetical protein